MMPAAYDKEREFDLLSHDDTSTEASRIRVLSKHQMPLTPCVVHNAFPSKDN